MKLNSELAYITLEPYDRIRIVCIGVYPYVCTDSLTRLYNPLTLALYYTISIL